MITFENRDDSITTVSMDRKDIPSYAEQVEIDVNVWDLMTNLIENQTEDVYFIDKLEELKSELEFHLENNE
jgi:hypothetical protein